MVDKFEKNIVPHNKWESKNNLNNNLDKDLDSVDFSDELSNLENVIREKFWEKIQERESEVKNNEIQDIKNKTKSELDSIKIDKVSEFFDQGKEEFKKIDTFKEKKVVRKHNKYINRPIEVKDAIEDSSDRILDEIYNWKKEKNVVSRSLLRIVNWIIKTEK